MIPFQPLHDESPVLQFSPLLIATIRAFSYVAENGPIGLTPSKALKRYFVTLASEARSTGRITVQASSTI